MTPDGLWGWAVAAYGRPGAADLFLDLQDGHEQNVPLLLFAAWTAATGRVLGDEALEEAVDVAGVWERTTIKPLRLVRRGLKGKIPDMDDAAREAVREEIKAVELSAERRLLETLERIAPAEGGAPSPIAPRLIAAAKQWDRVVPRGTLEALARTLSEAAG
jgi:uncharacterized protein (TIGR02444 family)